MSSFFNLMIEDITISEADFSSDAFSQCQTNECPPTEPFSAQLSHNSSKFLGLQAHHSAEEAQSKANSRNPLGVFQRFHSQDHRSIERKGRLAWILFEEEELCEEHCWEKHKKLVEEQRDNINTSEFFLEEEKPKEIILKCEQNQEQAQEKEKDCISKPVKDFNEFATPKKTNTFQRKTPLLRKTIKKSSFMHFAKTPKHSCFEKVALVEKN